MARLRVLLFASVLCSFAVYGQGGVSTQEVVTITVPSAVPSVASSTAAYSSSSSKATDLSSTASIASSSSSKAAESSSTASIASSSSSKATESSSTASIASSSSSKATDLSSTASNAPEITTTTAPTTPESTTQTTTSTTTLAPSPAPSPTPKPAPTPAPGPVPSPQQGMWSYKENNVTCILVQFAAQFNITYNKNVDNSTSLTYMLLNLPKNATVLDGSCNATGTGEQFLQLGWPTAENSLTLHFTLNDTTKSYALSSLNVTLAPEQFPDSSWKQPVQLSHKVGWWTPLATSYRCAAATQLNMSTELWPEAATLTLSKLQEEAFMHANNTKPAFSAARDCGGSDVPDAVPIAVGCALGGLVVVVLVAYLVGRRRSAARGYLSM